jgi:hypothetical protein
MGRPSSATVLFLFYFSFFSFSFLFLLYVTSVFSFFVQIWILFRFQILLKFQNYSDFEFCSNLKIVQISIFVQLWKLFRFQICSDLKIVQILIFVQIWKLFTFQVLFKFENCLDFIFVQIWKLFRFQILFKKNLSKKVAGKKNLMGRGPACLPCARGARHALLALPTGGV